MAATPSCGTKTTAAPYGSATATLHVRNRLPTRDAPTWVFEVLNYPRKLGQRSICDVQALVRIADTIVG